MLSKQINKPPLGVGRATTLDTRTNAARGVLTVTEARTSRSRPAVGTPGVVGSPHISVHPRRTRDSPHPPWQRFLPPGITSYMEGAISGTKLVAFKSARSSGGQQ